MQVVCGVGVCGVCVVGVWCVCEWCRCVVCVGVCRCVGVGVVVRSGERVVVSVCW